MFDRSWTVAFRAAGAVTLPAEYPGGEPVIELEAWQDSFSAAGGGAAFVDAAPVWVFSGSLSTADCAQRLTGGGIVDCLMVIPSGGVGRVRLESDVKGLTVYTDQAPNDVLGVTLRARQIIQ